MKAQNQIKRTLSEPSHIEYINQLLHSEDITNRTDLASRACQQFGFYDVRGKKQISGCLKAIRELETAGHFLLPKPQQKPVKKTPRRLTASVPLPVDVPADVTAIEKLELVLVGTVDEMRLWNELMIEEHPLKNGPLVGRQIRYLIRSAHGWLGGFGFAAPTLQLSDRDQWIGWTREQRQKHLHYIVGMSRFLIRPSVSCKNLASKVLSMSIARLPDDFEQKYHYRPLLIEGFVDTRQYSGACYRAANWLEIGATKGRGRQDRYSRSSLSRKVIYIYALEKPFRDQLGLLPDAGLGALDPSQGLESELWAENEFGGASVGDKRLSKRLVKVASAKAENPTRAFSGVAKGDWPATKAYYRMIDQPEDAEFTLENILAPHRQRTSRRMKVNVVPFSLWVIGSPRAFDISSKTAFRLSRALLIFPSPSKGSICTRSAPGDETIDR